MSQPESPLAPLLRLLDASFRVGRFFGTEVRVYGAWLILLFLVVLPLQGLSWLPLGERLLYVAIWTLTLYLTVWIHEMGHALGARRYHIRTPLITLSPLGGLAHMQSAAPNPKASILISAAGPATHLLTLAFVWPLSVLVAGAPFSWAYTSAPGAGGPVSVTYHLEVVPFLLDRLVELNLFLLLFNLLPLYPLDGGSIFRSLLALRMHPNRATLIAARVGMVGSVGLALAGLLFVHGVGGGFLVALAVTNWFACQRAVLEARHSDGPYGEPSQPWEEDPEAWKSEAPPDVPRPSRRKRTRPRGEDAPDVEELDRLLDRVKEVGLAGLSEAERAALLRASDARRAGH